MREWVEFTLSEITSKIGDGLHGTPKYADNGNYYFINGNNIKNGKIEIKPETNRVTEETALTHKKPLSNDTILLSINGTIGNLAVYNGEKCMLGKSVCYINPNNTVVSKFLYYSFLNQDFQNFLELIATGTTIPNVPLKGLRDYTLKLPPLPEQQAIAEVLSSLDDKIDLLHRNNKTLEEMAETLFRQWFVEGAKEESDLRKLGEFIKLESGYSYRSVDLNPSQTALVTLKNFNRNGGFRLDGFKEYTGKYKPEQLVRMGDLVVAHTDITQEAEVLGNPAMIIDDGRYEALVISTDLVKVIPTEFLSKPFLYYLMRQPDFKHYCLGASNGTTVLHLSKKALPEYEFYLPSEKLVADFTKAVVPVFEKIGTNIKQINHLESTRNTLLPKLMSGQVRVNT